VLIFESARAWLNISQKGYKAITQYSNSFFNYATDALLSS